MHEWMNRSLENVYPVAFFDAMHVKIRNGTSIRNMAIHLAIGVCGDGTREDLGMWLVENEGAAFWAIVFNSLPAPDMYRAPSATLHGLCFPQGSRRRLQGSKAGLSSG